MPILTNQASRFLGGGKKWYTAAGAPMPVAVYQPKGAASLAASRINLANPGTYDAADGVAPTFDPATGWAFDGAKFLATGITAATGWSALVRFTDCTMIGYQTAIGAYNGANDRFQIMPSFAGGKLYGNGGALIFDPPTAIAGGVMAIAGSAAYLDGIAESGAMGAWDGPGAQIYIGSRNAIPNDPFIGKIQAIAIYDSTLTAGQVAAISAAMAAL